MNINVGVRFMMMLLIGQNVEYNFLQGQAAVKGFSLILNPCPRSMHLSFLILALLYHRFL